MRFQNPAGLWLLCGIPVLILIWLIRPRHEDRRVSSSYIWRLSDRFMKKRLPFTLLARWLVFLLQLLLVTGGAFLAARPVLAREERADYLAILDASASMRTVTESGLTRYETAAEWIRGLAKETGRGHTVTVITAGEEARTIVSESSSRKEISDALAASPCGWGGSSLSSAMTLAQLFCYEHPEAEVFVYTDQTVEETENVTVVPCGGGEWNVSLTGLGAARDGEGGCVLEAQLTSWGRDARIAVGLTVDGRLTEVSNFECQDGAPVKVSFAAADVESIRSAALSVDPGDAFEWDNELVYFPDNERPCDTLLVSETPLYLGTALTALDRGKVRISADASSAEGYDLAIFDGAVSENLPEAGAVLLIDPDRMPDGMTVRGPTSGEAEEGARALVASAADSDLKDSLLRDMKLGGVTAAKHTAADLSDDWTTVCSAGIDPVLAARKTENGSVLCALLFDLHDSNLPLKTDFLYLIRNLMNIAVPSLLEKRVTEVGAVQRVTLTPNADSVRITAPDGLVTEFAGEGTEKLAVTLPGTYLVEAGDEETGFFAAVPKTESAPQTVSALSVFLPGTAEEAEETPEEAESGLWRIAAAVLLVLLLTEWGIWLYEQF